MEKTDNSTLFDAGYKMGAAHVIEDVRNRLYYVPEEWKTGYTAVLINSIESLLETSAQAYGVKMRGDE